MDNFMSVLNSSSEKDKFLEKNKLPKLTQGVDNMTSSTFIEEI